jgi:hypothetical protein
VLRSAGDVGCAHCAKSGADQSCQVCTRLVCPTCAADWATCDEPSGRMVRLGRSARVRDVDPLGRLALVSHWREPLRLFDLRQLRWVPDIEIERRIYLWSRAAPPRLAADGSLVYADVDRRGGELVYRGIHWHAFGRAQDAECVADRPVHGTPISATRDRYWYITDSQHVVVMSRQRPDARPTPAAASLIMFERELPTVPQQIVKHVYEPLSRKVVQAAFVDGERDLLASASWSELALHRLVDGRSELISRAKTDIEGDVIWLAVAGPWYVAAVRRSGGAVRLQLHRLDATYALGPVARAITLAAPLLSAALSRGGRHLAIATREGLTVHDLDTAESSTFDEHTDDINYVRFASDDHLLISADADNRVILRPRTTTGYARALLTVTVDQW